MRPIRLGSIAIPPITAIIMLVLVVCFITAGIVTKFVPTATFVVDLMPVIAGEVMAGQVWRLVSYGLVHSLTDPFHLIFNCLFIYLFGRELEERWGTGRYLLFAFLTVLVGGTFVVGAGLLGIGSGVALGASAFAEGLIVAWGLLFRDRPMRMFFAIPVKGITMVWMAIGLWVLDAVSQSPNSAAAHLGGMITAAVLVLGVWRPNHVKAWWASLRQKVGGKKQPALFIVPGPSASGPGKGPDKKWVN